METLKRGGGLRRKSDETAVLCALMLRSGLAALIPSHHLPRADREAPPPPGASCCSAHSKLPLSVLRQNTNTEGRREAGSAFKDSANAIVAMLIRWQRCQSAQRGLKTVVSVCVVIVLNRFDFTGHSASRLKLSPYSLRLMLLTFMFTAQHCLIASPARSREHRSLLCFHVGQI